VKYNTFEAKDDEQIVVGGAGITAEQAGRGYTCTLCVAVHDPTGNGETTTVDIHLTDKAVALIELAITAYLRDKGGEAG